MMTSGMVPAAQDAIHLASWRPQSTTSSCGTTPGLSFWKASVILASASMRSFWVQPCHMAIVFWPAVAPAGLAAAGLAAVEAPAAGVAGSGVGGAGGPPQAATRLAPASRAPD